MVPKETLPRGGGDGGVDTSLDLANNLSWEKGEDKGTRGEYGNSYKIPPPFLPCSLLGILRKVPPQKKEGTPYHFPRKKRGRLKEVCTWELDPIVKEIVPALPFFPNSIFLPRLRMRRIFREENAFLPYSLGDMAKRSTKSFPIVPSPTPPENWIFQTNPHTLPHPRGGKVK